MIALGILAILYSLFSFVLPKLGYQLMLLKWMHGMPDGVQWGVRGLLLAVGVACIVIGIRARRQRR